MPCTWRTSPQARDQAAAKAWRSGTFTRTITNAGATRATLSCESIRWGGEVRCDERVVGTHDLGFAPVTVELGAMAPGEHAIAITARGWPSLPRFDTGDPTIPCSAANWFYDASGGLPGRVRLYRYRGARIAAIRATPHPDASCDLAIEIVGGEQLNCMLYAAVTSEDGRRIFARMPARPLAIAAGQTLKEVVELELPGAPRWSPEDPDLLRVVAWLVDDSGVAHALETEFGLRVIAISHGHVCIDGKRTRLFGASTMFRIRDPALVADGALVTAYAGTWLRGMNANVCQPHMDPIYGAWLETCDRTGMLVFCEMPNFPDVQRLPMWSLESPYEREEFWTNLRREIAALIAARANHPCIIAWTPSNEGNGFGDWERQHLFPFVKGQDPTRPVLFSGDITPDFADQHSFSGNWYGTAGDFERGAEALATAFRGVRPVGNSEFAQYQGGPVWYGERTPTADELLQDAARIALEQSEALRRNRFDMVMPFNYPVAKAYQTGNVVDVEPAWHALRNAYAPLAVSIDWRWRHARAGVEIDVPIWLMSDAADAAGSVTIDVAVVAGDPGFAWNGDLATVRAVTHARIEVACEPWGAVRTTVRLRLPAQAGDYAIVALLPRRDSRAAVVSHRPLRLYAPLPETRSLAIGVIEQDGRIAAWLRARGHRLVLPYGDEPPHAVVVGEGMLVDARMRVHGFGLARRIESGTRLIVLEQRAWNTQIMAGLVVAGLESSSLQVAVEPLHPLPGSSERIGTWQDYRRLTGEDGVGLRVRIAPPAAITALARTAIGTGQPDHVVASSPGVAVAASTSGESPWKPLIVAYTRGVESPDWALAHRSAGRGDAYACQIPLVSRLDPTDATTHDPVAERLFAHLVEGPRPG